MAAKVVLFSYYVVAIPVAYVLGFYTNMGVTGLAWGITLGTFVHSGIYAFLVSRIDWNQQSQLAVRRAGGTSKTEEQTNEKLSLLDGEADDD